MAREVKLDGHNARAVLYAIPFAMEQIREVAKKRKWRPSELAMTLGDISRVEDDIKQQMKEWM